jgi:Ribosomal RNA adenine dimethylase
VFARLVDCPDYGVNGAPSAAATRLLSALAATRDAAGMLGALYANSRPAEERTRHGQFFTDPRTADWVVRLARLRPVDRVWDVAAGPAVFGERITRARFKISSYTAIESDAVLALSAAHVLQAVHAPGNFRVLCADFFVARPAKPPTVVISNPPFARWPRFMAHAARHAAKAPRRATPRLFFLLPAAAARSAHLPRAWQRRMHRVPRRSARGPWRSTPGVLLEFRRVSG